MKLTYLLLMTMLISCSDESDSIDHRTTPVDNKSINENEGKPSSEDVQTDPDNNNSDTEQKDPVSDNLPQVEAPKEDIETPVDEDKQCNEFAIIALEAENFQSQVEYSIVNKDGAIGSSIQASANDSYANYEIDVPLPGRYFIYIRTFAEDHEDNGLMYYLNDDPIQAPSGHACEGSSEIWLQKNYGNNIWYWESKFQCNHSAHGPVVVDIPTASTHKFTIGKKHPVERPFIDKVVLSTLEISEAELNGMVSKCE